MHQRWQQQRNGVGCTPADDGLQQFGNAKFDCSCGGSHFDLQNLERHNLDLHDHDHDDWAGDDDWTALRTVDHIAAGPCVNGAYERGGGS